MLWTGFAPLLFFCGQFPPLHISVFLECLPVPSTTLWKPLPFTTSCPVSSKLSPKGMLPQLSVLQTGLTLDMWLSKIFVYLLCIFYIYVFIRTRPVLTHNKATCTYVHTHTHQSWYLINESSNDYNCWTCKLVRRKRTFCQPWLLILTAISTSFQKLWFWQKPAG